MTHIFTDEDVKKAVYFRDPDFDEIWEIMPDGKIIFNVTYSQIANLNKLLGGDRLGRESRGKNFPIRNRNKVTHRREEFNKAGKWE